MTIYYTDKYTIREDIYYKNDQTCIFYFKYTAGNDDSYDIKDWLGTIRYNKKDNIYSIWSHKCKGNELFYAKSFDEADIMLTNILNEFGYKYLSPKLAVLL
jgi:hypothetical protein